MPLRKPHRLFLCLALLCVGIPAGAQVPMASSFAGGAPPASTSAMPNAPDANPSTPPVHAMIRVLVPAAEQPLVLPRNFRITPSASRSTAPGKVSYYISSTWSGRNLVEAALIMGVPNVTNPPQEPLLPTVDTPAADMAYQNAMDNYGDQMRAWGDTIEEMARYRARRFEVGLATAETRDLASNLILPLALHQQARYIPAPVDADFSERMENALTSVVVTRNDAGMLVPNYSKLGGTVIAAFLGKSLYANAFNAPELNSGHFVERYIGYSLLGDMATNTAHEIVRAALEPDLTYYGIHGRATDDSYYPLSMGGKLVYWLRSTYAPRNFISAALIADLPVIPHRPIEPVQGQPATWSSAPDYNTAYDNYGLQILGWKDTIEQNVRWHARRFAGGLSESESEMFLQNFAIPVAFDMDPRYVPLGSGYSASQRLGHAFAGVFVTHTDAGTKTVNLPVLGGTVGAAFAAKELYYPQLNTPELASNGVLAKTIGLNLVADGLYNVIGEFLRHRGY